MIAGLAAGPAIVSMPPVVAAPVATVAAKHTGKVAEVLGIAHELDFSEVRKYRLLHLHGRAIDEFLELRRIPTLINHHEKNIPPTH
jgi:hypothetical protein